jgi:hypothetical protein
VLHDGARDVSGTESSEGLFPVWQPRYSGVGLPTFPVEGKKPSVRGYLRITLERSAQLATRFPGSNAFGIVLGWRTAITVLDVDTPDEDVLKAALVSFGDTPFLVRTGSGHFQAWYSHRGERRRIRPLAGLPIDILGGGFVVAPPSLGSAGSYEVIRGSLDDLLRLPPMRDAYQIESAHAEIAGVTEGHRNNELFRYALVCARQADDEQSLLQLVRIRNEKACVPRLADREVSKLVHSAWRYQVRGRNFVGSRFIPASVKEIEDLASAQPDALALLMMLRRFHQSRPEFALGKAMAKKIGWSFPRFRAARAGLEGAGYIRCLHPGGMGRHDPPIYVLA